MNNNTQAIITTLGKYKSRLTEVNASNTVTARYNESLYEKITAEYQICITVANLHEYSKDLEYIKAWFFSEFREYTNGIEMVPFHFEDLKTLRESLRELSNYYAMNLNEERLLKNIKDETPVYIVAFLIPQLVLKGETNS